MVIKPSDSKAAQENRGPGAGRFGPFPNDYSVSAAVSPEDAGAVTRQEREPAMNRSKIVRVPGWVGATALLITAVGTVLALRSVTLRNELAGAVRQVRLAPDQVVEPGTVLVALDVSVETASLRAEEARAALTETTLLRLQKLLEHNAVSAEEVDR